MAKESWVINQIQTNSKLSVRSVQEELQRKYELNVSKMKAFRAKAKATYQVKGDYKEQYATLRDYIAEVQQKNPNTTVKIEVEREDDPDSPTRIFKRIYICYGALKEGFKECRRELLGLDGAFMKGPYPGQMLSAVGIDPNNGIFPLAYGIVETENKDSWSWFLQCLADDLDLIGNSNFTIISDRQKGLIPAVAQVLPAAEHRYCVRHIHQNMKLKWRGKGFKDILWGCATSTTVPEFQAKMVELKALNVEAYNWVASIPPQHWTRSHFTGRAKSDVLLSNMCEVFNSKVIEGRDKPIIGALDYVREYLMRRIANVLNLIDKHNGPLTPAATDILDKTKTEAAKYNVMWDGGIKYQVSGPWGDQCVVDSVERTCSCRKWELTGLPCKHAVAVNWNMAFNNQQVGIPESWADPCYRLETWRRVYQKSKIGPITGRKMWLKYQCPTTLKPPLYKTPIGRPKKKRRINEVEAQDNLEQGGKLTRKYRSVTCSKCNNYGHNSKGCKEQGAPQV